VSTAGVFAGAMNVSRTTNVQTLIATSNIGTGGANLNVTGNLWVSNAIQTGNLYVSLVNASTMNTLTLLVSNIGVGTGAFGNTMSVLGNIFVSNSVSTTNIVAVSSNTANINVVTMNTLTTTVMGTSNTTQQTLNIATINVLSVYTPSGLLGINTSTNLGASLQVLGNIFVSNALTGGNLYDAGTLYYNEDVTKRSIHLLPTPSNASAIQSWISATCNASDQPSRSWWPTSQVPVFGNVATGPTSGGVNFQGSVLLPDGRVLFCPHGAAPNVGVYNPATGLFSLILPTGASIPVNSFNSPVLLPTGNVIFTPQNSTSNILTYNPLTLVLSNSYVPGTGFVGAVLDPTGNVVMMPNSAGSNIGSYNPVLNTYSNIVRVGNDGSFNGAVLLPNGNVVGIPQTNSNIIQYNPLTNPPVVSNSVSLGGSGTQKFFGGVLAPNGNVIMVPFSGTGTSNIGVFNPSALTFTNVTTYTGGTAFVGGALLASGNVIMAPYVSSNVGMFDPVALQYSNCVITGTSSGFTGATLLPSGQVVFVPFNSANVGLLDTFTPAPQEFCLSPYFNKY